jgi:peptidoglycan/LPS O-acetylase OafA/YrhL
LIPGNALSTSVNRLRGYALLLVLVFHIGGILEWPNVAHGDNGVDIFLIISGFTLALTNVETPTWVFIRRRFLRIFPAYWMALALFVGLEWHFSNVQRTWTDLSLHFFGVHSFSRAKYLWGINDSFWFISEIVFCYALFLAVRRHMGDLAFLVRFCGFVTVALAAYYLVFDHRGDIPFMVTRIPDFFFGLIAGQLASGRGLDFRPGFLLALALLLLAYISITFLITDYHLVPALGFLCVFLSLEPVLARVAAGRLVLGALGILGTYSYELYLLHQPLMRNYSRMVIERVYGITTPTSWQLVAGIVFGFGVACIGAYLLHRVTDLVTRPWNRRSTAARG